MNLITRSLLDAFSNRPHRVVSARGPDSATYCGCGFRKPCEVQAHGGTRRQRPRGPSDGAGVLFAGRIVRGEPVSRRNHVQNTYWLNQD